jgi:hypothetical protein
MTKMSVQPEWCRELPLQQQSVLFLAARGPDGVAKDHPCKDVLRAYRGTVLVAAKYGRPLSWGEKADGFMSLDKFGELEAWSEACYRYFLTVDSLPLHFHMHLLHGAEILGYKHPDERFRIGWGTFYLQGVRELHLAPETEEEMDERLSDWYQGYWEL